MATTEEPTKPPEETKFVNKGILSHLYNPNNPQAYLQKSNHPYAPFTGNAFTWESLVFDDGTCFEGLCREEVPHGKGIIKFGNGWGGGIQNTNFGDRFEGEMQAGFAHGLGQYTSAKTKEVYRGEFYAGKRQGCGMLLNYTPYNELMDSGVHPYEAWEQTKDGIIEKAKYGTWKKDYFVSGPEESGRFCHINEIKGTLEELEVVLTQVRMFENKPEGDVLTYTAHDEKGTPIEPMQDPLLYPMGTGYLAPGPAGQCVPLPDDENLKNQMSMHAINHQIIWDQYNFDYDPAPGSDMWKAQKWWKKEKEKEKAEQARLQEKEERRRRILQNQGEGGGRAGSSASPSTGLASISIQLARGAGQVARAFERFALQPRPRLSRPGRRERS